MKSFKLFLFVIVALFFLSKIFLASAESLPDLVPTTPTLSISPLPVSNLTGGSVSWPVYVLNRENSGGSGLFKVIFNTKNQGAASTYQGFKNRITITNAPNGGGDVYYPELIDQNTILAPGASAQSELEWYFQPGIYSIQACVDDEKIGNSSGYSIGVVWEGSSYTTAAINNCSEWTNIDIRDYSQNIDVSWNLTPYLYPSTKTAILESRDTRGNNGVGYEYGFCVGISPSPTDCKATNPPENQIFSDSWVLNSSTKYYFRSYLKRAIPADTRLPTVIAYSVDEAFTMSADSTSSDLVISDAVRVDSNGNPTTDPIKQGEYGYFKATVTNNGSGSTLFPSTSSILHTTHAEEVHNSNHWREYSLAGSKIDSLAAGASKEITIFGTFNDCGINWYKVCTDDDSRNSKFSRRFGASYYISETNEVNNCSPGAWQNNTVDVLCPQAEEVVVPKLPDLTVLPGIAPTSVVMNVPNTYSATVKNIGESTTGASFVNIFQTATNIDNLSNPTDLKDYATSSMATLASGASANTSKSITFTSAGTYYIRACADKSSAGSTGVITESDENNNNCNVWTQVVVSSDPYIDLVVTNVTPKSAVINKSTVFSATVKNEGNTGTGKDFKNFFQIATGPNGTGDITDKPATTMSMLSAGGGDVMKLTHTFTKNGTYYLRACADKSSSSNLGVITETNKNNNAEDNNCSSAWVAVIVDDGSVCKDPDAANSGLPGKCFYGEGLCINPTAKNYGEILPCDTGAGGGGGSVPVAGTCTDGKKNGTETGVDCGGSCKKCGIKYIEI